MGTVIDALYAPIQIRGAKNKNVDPRYFKDNGDGTYSFTPLLIRNLSRDAVKYFKNRICELDSSCEFHSESLKSVNDNWEKYMHDMQWKAKYGELTKEATKRWYAYRDAHPDEFETRYKMVSVGGEDEARYFRGYSPDVKCGLIDSVQAYNAVRELFAKYDKGGSEYSTLPMTEPLFSKEEFVEAHKKVRENISKELGIPEDTFVAKEHKVEKISHRINNARCDKVGINDEALEAYVKGLIKYLTNNTAEDINKAKIEMAALIDKDFIMNFNDSAKELKAVEDINDSIAIYTKLTDGEAATKLITIEKDATEDISYKFNLSATSDDGTTINYRKNVSTKADLVKAMEISIEMLSEDASLKKYCADIKAALETL